MKNKAAITYNCMCVHVHVCVYVCVCVCVCEPLTVAGDHVQTWLEEDCGTSCGAHKALLNLRNKNNAITSSLKILCMREHNIG